MGTEPREFTTLLTPGGDSSPEPTTFDVFGDWGGDTQLEPRSPQHGFRERHGLPMASSEGPAPSPRLCTPADTNKIALLELKHDRDGYPVSSADRGKPRPERPWVRTFHIWAKTGEYYRCSQAVPGNHGRSATFLPSN